MPGLLHSAPVQTVPTCTSSTSKKLMEQAAEVKKNTDEQKAADVTLFADPYGNTDLVAADEILADTTDDDTNGWSGGGAQ